MNFPPNDSKTPNGNKYFLFLGILIFIQFFLFTFYGFWRHLNYLSSINDLGHFDQAIWGFLKSSPFLNTDIVNQKISRLGIHFDPILVIFVPFYYILPHVGWLILSQSLALSIASLPIFLLARKIFDSDKTAFFWAIIFGFNPFILNAAAWDFHPISLAVPFIGLSYLTLETKNFRLFSLSCLLILLCKEHFGLMVLFFGLLWGLKHQEWKRSLSLSMFGLFFLLVVFYLIMPHFSPSGKHIMLSSGQGQLSRYEWLGRSIFDIIAGIFKNPIETFSIVLLQLGGGKYLLSLLLPFFFFPVLALEMLLPGAADLTANLLSANPLPRSVFSYHSATLIPVITVAAMFGTKKLCLILKKWSTSEVSSLILVAILIFGWAFFPFFNLPGSKNIWNPQFPPRLHDPVLERITQMINENASISVQGNIGAHFSQREQIFAFPNRIGDVDFVVLHLDIPTKNPELDKPKQVGSLTHHLLMKPDKFIESVTDLLHDDRYGIVVWEGSWLVFQKGKPDMRPRSDVKNFLNKLYLNWTMTQREH